MVGRNRNTDLASWLDTISFSFNTPLHLIHLLGSGAPRPVVESVYKLAEMQLSRGHKVAVWHLGFRACSSYCKRTVPIVEFPRKQDGFGIDGHLRRALDRLPQAAQIHIHGTFQLDFSFFVQHLRLVDRSYCYTPYHTLLEGEWNFRGQEVPFSDLRPIHRFLAGAKAIQLIDQWEHEQMASWHSCSRHYVIPSGCPAIGLVQGRKRSGRGLLFGAFCQPDVVRSGIDLLFDGFQRYRLEGGSGRLQMACRPAAYETVHRLIRQRYLEAAVFPAILPVNTGIHSLLSWIDLYIDTRRAGGITANALTAAAIGLPLMVSSPTALPSFISRYGAGIPLHENSVEAIAAALHRSEELFSEAALPVLGDNARQMVREVFNWSDISDQLEVLYRL